MNEITILIVKLLQLKGIGRKTIFSILETIEEDNFDYSINLVEFINIVSNKHEKIAKKLSNLTYNDFNNAENYANDIIAKSKENGIKIISYFDDIYPISLKESKDPPIILNYIGNIEILNTPKLIAIIGTREPTPEGVKAGLHFGEAFAQNGYSIVSGLAVGCDTLAHQGCLLVNGKTVAILGNGLNDSCIYPPQNLYITKDILKKDGLLLSEYFINTKVNPSYLIDRDRLQAAISSATIVIQTGVKGGSMHAVNATLDSGKTLACVKYNKDDDKMLGNNYLINNNKAFALTSKNISEFIETLNNTPIKTYYKKMKLKGVIFDLDQTLIDTSIAESMRNQRNWDEVYGLVPFFQMYEGVKEVLNYLQDNKIKVGVVTNSPSKYAKMVLDYFQIAYNSLIAYHDVKNRKPHPEPMLKVTELMGLNTEDVISFGDKAADIESSNNAKILSVACIWGGDVKEFANVQPNYTINNPKEIIKIFENKYK
ncbi:MAG: HAD-IA family hydrolase [Dysgonomonas sp.]|nr:HAD-IA family hydrolase [Dysgonomonas sp.]